MINKADLDKKFANAISGIHTSSETSFAFKLFTMFEEPFSAYLDIVQSQTMCNHMAAERQKIFPWLSFKPVEISPFKFLLCLHVPKVHNFDSIEDAYNRVFGKIENAKMIHFDTDDDLKEIAEEFPSIVQKSSRFSGRVNAVGVVEDDEIRSFGCVEGFPFSKNDKKEHCRHFVIISVEYAYKKSIA